VDGWVSGFSGFSGPQQWQNGLALGQFIAFSQVSLFAWTIAGNK